MKHVWKRAMSLLLSGVLLVGNVPFAALATEEPVEELIVEEVLEEVTQTPEPQAADTVATTTVEIPAVTDAVANANAEPQDNSAIDYPVMVGDTYVTSANAADILGDGKVSFTTATVDGVTKNTLTLKGATVSSISWGAFEDLGPELTVFLPEGTESTISGELKAEGDLSGCIKITGPGKLNVGRIGATDNLTIDNAVVKVGTDKQEGQEQQTLIKVKNAIAFTGAAHLATGTGHKAVAFTDTAAKLMGNGYIRIAKDGAFSPVTAETAIAANGAYLEFVSVDHLAYSATDTQHVFGCNSECKLDKTVILTEDHSRGQEDDKTAGCGEKAYCSVCKLSYGTEEVAHRSANTKFEKVDNSTHKEVYVCCNADKENTVTQPHAPIYQTSGSVISAVCNDCAADGTATLEANGGLEDGSQFGATVEKNGILSDTVFVITYMDKDGQSSEEAPSAYGKYTASIIADEKTASVEYYITKNIAEGDVQLDSNRLVYNGQPQTKNVFKKNADSDVTFEVENNTQTEAGEHTLTVNGTFCYSGSVNLSYSIDKAENYNDVTVREQTLIDNAEVQLPKFTGVARQGSTEPENVDGDCVYTFTYNNDTQEVSEAEISGRIADMHDGDEATLHYIFTPAADGNYTGTKEGNILIKKVKITFTHDGNSVNAVDLLKNGNTITYGDTDFISLDKLTAHVGDKTDAYDAQKQNFFVKYTGDGVEGEKNAPEVKYNKFTVYYSGELDGKTFEKVPVCGPQHLVVNKKRPTVSVNPVSGLVETGEKQIVVTGSTDGGILKYSFDNMQTWVEMPEQIEPAAYWVYYKVEGDSNFEDLPAASTQKVIAKILPKLEATYGDMIASIELPEDWSWELNGKKAEEESVGPAGIYEAYQYKLAYNADKDSTKYPTLTDEEVPLTVHRKEIKIQVTLPETHYKLVLKASGVELEKTITPTVKYYKTETELVDLPSAEYDVDRSLEEYPGSGEVVVTSKELNYDFSQDSDNKEAYIVYRPGVYNLTIVPGTLESSYADVEELQEALQNGLSEKHTEDDVKFYNVKMQEYNAAENKWDPTDEEFYCPPGGFTYTLSYPTGENENTKFELVGINTMQSAASRSVEKIDFILKSNGIEFQMKNYAAVCLAWDGYDDTSTFAVKTSASNGKVQFTIGTDTTKKTSADAVKVGEKLTITATPNTNYALTKIQYYETATGTNVKTITQNDEGKYILEMPAKDITIKATFSKKTTSTKNPYSGDTSNIHLWLTILAASAVGIVALVIVWFKKRKK